MRQFGNGSVKIRAEGVSFVLSSAEESGAERLIHGARQFHGSSHIISHSGYRGAIRSAPSIRITSPLR